MINTASSLHCPRKGCTAYQSKSNNIKKDGTYTVKSENERRQMFFCTEGKHRFSETGYSNLFGKHGSFKEYEQTAKLTSYGVSTDHIADVIGKDTRTISVWQAAIGDKSKRFHQYLCTVIGLTINFLQMDELWSYLKCKRHQLWVFIGFESESKFWINFELGSRTTNTAKRLVQRIQEVAKESKKKIKVTTDKLAAYKNALKKCLFKPYVYLQIVKIRFKRRLITVKKVFVKGKSSDFSNKTQNTSFIERFNLTLRQKISYLTRKTLGYCKNKTNMTLALWINLFDYNYRMCHRSLRLDLIGKRANFEKRYQHFTPGMKMGLTKTPLSWKYLFVVPIPITH